MRNVINAGQDAVDADGAIDERRLRRTAKPCGPDTPTLVSSRRKMIPQATVARKPGHRGEPENKPLKPLRRKRRVDPVNLW